MAKVIQVIEVETTRGEGVEFDPTRSITQYWSLDGTLLAEVDPCAPQYFFDYEGGRLQDAGWVVRKNHHVKRQGEKI